MLNSSSAGDKPPSGKKSRAARTASAAKTPRASTKPQKKVPRKSPLKIAKASGAQAALAKEDADQPRMYLEPREVRAFFSYMPQTSFWYPYFFIQYYYGCRLSDPALLRDSDVDFEKKTIRIRRLKREHEPGGFKEFVYEADERVLECVRIAQTWKSVKNAQDNPFLFVSKKKRNPDEIGEERLSKLRGTEDGSWQAISRFTAHRVFKKIAKAVHFPKHLQKANALRHARAPFLLAQGVSRAEVQQKLGHATRKVTRLHEKIAKLIRDKLDAEIARGFQI